jgi:hypothetical protein
MLDLDQLVRLRGHAELIAGAVLRTPRIGAEMVVFQSVEWSFFGRKNSERMTYG